MKKHLQILGFLNEFFLSISGGRSTSLFLENYFQSLGSVQLASWQVLCLQLWKDPYSLPCLEKDLSQYEVLMVRLVRSSLLGGSVSNELKVLIEEYQSFALMDSEISLQKLPMYLSVVMLFLLFPSYILLILGPVFSSFNDSF